MTKLVWVDVETTGLSADSDGLLEMAVAVSEFDRPFEIKHIGDSVFTFHSAAMDAFVRDMHTKSGLLRECAASATSPALFEQRMLSMLPNTDLILAGSSVHFDARFIRVWMPQLFSRFSHRHYDVSAIKLFCQSLGMPKIPKGEAHRAVPDIDESVQHAKMCAEWLSSGPLYLDAILHPQFDRLALRAALPVPLDGTVSVPTFTPDEVRASYERFAAQRKG